MTGPLFLGVDGGGTATRLALVDATGRVVGRLEGGTTNQAVVGMDAATTTLRELIASAAADAGASLPLAGGWVGLAGSDRDAERAAIRNALAGLVANPHVTSDAALALSATPDGTGIALIAGTGSIAFGRAPNGGTGRAGGWGHVFGDEGSAYGIAVEALRAVAAADDGRGPETALTEALLAFWQVGAPQELIGRIYAPGVRKADIAAAAPTVIATALAGDAVARAILDDAASSLADLVHALARRLPFPDPPPVMASGGLILHAERLRAATEARLDSTLVQPALTCVDDLAASAAEAVRREHLGAPV